MAPSSKLQASTSLKDQRNTLKKSGQRPEKPATLSFYLPNVRLLLRRHDFSLKETMKTMNCSISIPHQSMTPNGSSSMVTISGKLEDVIKTRTLLQEETIMKYAFAINKRPSDDHPFVRRTEKVFNVKVEYLEANGYMKCLVLVKGLQKDWEKLQEATERLLQIFYFDRWEYITVNTILELPVQCQSILKEKTNFIRQVEQDTKTHVVFPTITNEIGGLARNLQIKICGNIQGVFTARQILINRLPASISINSSNATGIETIRKEMKDLRLKNGLSIQLKTNRIIIEGIERNYDALLKVGREFADILDNFKNFINPKNKSTLHSKIEALTTSVDQVAEEKDAGIEDDIKEEKNHDVRVGEEIVEISDGTSSGDDSSSSSEEMDDISRRASFGGSSLNVSSTEDDIGAVFITKQTFSSRNAEDDFGATFTTEESMPLKDEDTEEFLVGFQNNETFNVSHIPSLRIVEDMDSVYRMEEHTPSIHEDIEAMVKLNRVLPSAFDSSSQELKNLYEQNDDIVDRILATDSNAFQDLLATALNYPVLPKTSAGLWNWTNVDIQIKPLCTVISDLLDYLELGHYYTIFERNNIGIEKLSEMNEMDLENIGIGSSYARELILQHTRR